MAATVTSRLGGRKQKRKGKKRDRRGMHRISSNVPVNIFNLPFPMELGQHLASVYEK